jgi:hypothetical protein
VAVVCRITCGLIAFLASDGPTIAADVRYRVTVACTINRVTGARRRWRNTGSSGDRLDDSAPFAVPCLEQIESAWRERKGGCLRDVGSKRLAACRERRSVGPNLERQIPALIPALAVIRQRVHIPDDGIVGGVGDSNPRDVRSDPAEHVEVSDDLTTVRCVEVEGRPSNHRPECNLTEGSQETDDNKSALPSQSSPGFTTAAVLVLRFTTVDMTAALPALVWWGIAPAFSRHSVAAPSSPLNVGQRARGDRLTARLLIERVRMDENTTPTVDMSLAALSDAVGKASEDFRAVRATLDVARADIVSRNTSLSRDVVAHVEKVIVHLREADESLRAVLKDLSRCD